MTGPLTTPQAYLRAHKGPCLLVEGLGIGWVGAAPCPLPRDVHRYERIMGGRKETGSSKGHVPRNLVKGLGPNHGCSLSNRLL